MRDRLDVVIVGGGIVGLATARAIVRARPGVDVAILEKERAVAQHQTGRNSGVLHSGIYYRPGSQKAAMCVAGRLAMERFCTEHDVPFEQCGKVIVAVDERELPRLHQLEERARGQRRARGTGRTRAPPRAGAARRRYRRAARPETGVVDFSRRRARAGGGDRGRAEPRFASVTGRSRSTSVPTGDHRRAPTGATIHARVLVNAPGLQSDLVAAADGVRHDLQIVPFRGEFHELVGARGRARPPPDLPRARPRPAVPRRAPVAWGRRGRPRRARTRCSRSGARGTRGGRSRLGSCAGSPTFPGFWRMARQYWPVGVAEVYRSLNQPRARPRLLPASCPASPTATSGRTPRACARRQSRATARCSTTSCSARRAAPCTC